MKAQLTLALAVMIGLLTAHPSAEASNRETTLLEETVYRVQVGKIDDIKLLLERLDNPNATDKQGWPLLSIAAARTDAVALDIVKLLTKMGADVNFHGGRKNYPIMAAVQSGNAHIVEYLLEKDANYRATDAMGMRVVDFARQSGDKKIIKLIESAIDGDMLNLARMRSQAYLDKITYDLAYHACAMQYYSYYYQSKQDPIPQTKQDEVLNKHKGIVGKSMAHMATFFRIPRAKVLEVFNDTRGAIFSEMENLISNRWRRSKGVGQDGDMEKRCEPIAEPFKEDVFDKEELERRFN